MNGSVMVSVVVVDIPVAAAVPMSVIVAVVAVLVAPVGSAPVPDYSSWVTGMKQKN